jgi:hypothetical protein
VRNSNGNGKSSVRNGPEFPREDIDPLYAFDPVLFVNEVLGWEPDEKQIEVLQCKKRRMILMWGRQSGKTTLAAAKMLHMAVCFPGSLCVWMSTRRDHTVEVLSKVDGFLQRMGWKASRLRDGQLGRRLPNGSRILGLAARDATVRSYTANLVVIDEGAQVKDPVYDAVSPLLAKHNGTLMVLGTPQQKSGEFYRVWTDKELVKYWFRSLRKSSECPRISPQFLESERKTKPEAVIRREYECEFEQDGTTLLRVEDVNRLFEREE